MNLPKQNERNPRMAKKTVELSFAAMEYILAREESKFPVLTLFIGALVAWWLSRSFS